MSITSFPIETTPFASYFGIISVNDYPGSDTARLIAAVNDVNASFQAGTPKPLYLPAGTYTLEDTLPTFVGGGFVFGENRHKTYIQCSAVMTGDVFSWSESWIDGAYSFGGSPTNTLIIGDDLTGAGVRDMTILGNRDSASPQNGLVFYDRNDFVLVQNVDLMYFNGRAFYQGVLKDKTQSYMRESVVNNMTIWFSGSAATPAMEICTIGSGDATNTNDFISTSIFGSWGEGLVIRNQNASKAIGLLNFTNFRIETDVSSITTTASNLLRIGDTDPAYSGGVATVNFTGSRLIGPYTGTSALLIEAPDSVSGLRHADINYQGMIGAGLGKGLNIQAGQRLKFDLTSLSVSDTKVTIGASTQGIAAPIIINSGGLEKFYTYSIDASAVDFLFTPIFKLGNPSVTPNIIADPFGGSTRGVNAIDLQTLRQQNSEVASGGNAVIIGGQGNAASGLFGTVINGLFCRANAQQTYCLGNRTNARFNFGGLIFSNSSFLSQVNGGDHQFRLMDFSANTTDTTPVVMTSDKNAPSGINLNNIPTNAVFSTELTIVAIDVTDPTNWAQWRQIIGVLARAAADASYTGDATGVTAPDNSAGSGSTATIQVGADIVNEGLQITWTAPNTDNWHVNAYLRSVEVQ